MPQGCAHTHKVRIGPYLKCTGCGRLWARPIPIPDCDDCDFGTHHCDRCGKKVDHVHRCDVAVKR